MSGLAMRCDRCGTGFTGPATHDAHNCTRLANDPLASVLAEMIDYATFGCTGPYDPTCREALEQDRIDAEDMCGQCAVDQFIPRLEQLPTMTRKTAP